MRNEPVTMIQFTVPVVVEGQPVHVTAADDDR